MGNELYRSRRNRDCSGTVIVWQFMGLLNVHCPEIFFWLLYIETPTFLDSCAWEYKLADHHRICDRLFAGEKLLSCPKSLC